MTDLELIKLKTTIRPQSGSYRLFGEVFSCIQMVNSCICYSSLMQEKDNVPTEKLAEAIYDDSTKYLSEYGDKFGKRIILDLIAEQISDLKRIEYDSFCDGELSYNTLVWKDEE